MPLSVRLQLVSLHAEFGSVCSKPSRQRDVDIFTFITGMRWHDFAPCVDVETSPGDGDLMSPRMVLAMEAHGADVVRDV